MKIGVQQPLFLFADQAKNFNGYNLAFFKKYVSSIYLTRPWQVFKYRKRLKELGLDPDSYEFIFRVKTLNNRVDALLHFDGEPYHPSRIPPKQFLGLKVWHVMDYVFKASEAMRVLVQNGVEHVMGYARHDLHCDFFKRYYPSYINKVLSVPFGYGERFKSLVPFSKRESVCVAMGAVNPVNDPLCHPGTIDEYKKFYSHKCWTHELRRAVAENSSTLERVCSLLPMFPETKSPHVDPVKELNRHQVFMNDEGLLNFPPARTYEGIASGCIMAASRNPIYEELGFIEGVHYIAFEKNCLKDFQQQILYYLNRLDALKAMHDESIKLSVQFSHENIADKLYGQIKQKCC